MVVVLCRSVRVLRLSSLTACILTAWGARGGARMLLRPMGSMMKSGPWLAWCLLALCVLLALVSECVQRSLGALCVSVSARLQG